MSDARADPDASSTTGSEARELVRLAFPLALSSLGNVLLGLVDTAMVGRLDPVAMGGMALGNNVLFTVALLAMGLVAGADPLIAQAVGAGEEVRARRVLWESVRLAVVISLPTMVLVVLASYALEGIGIAHATAEVTRRFVIARLPNALTFLLSTATRSYLQAKGSTRPIIASVVVSNAVNVVLNVLLIFGDDGLARLHLPRVGLPPLGVVGSALSSVVASCAAVAVLARGVARVPAPADPERRRGDPEARKKILRLGAPIALQILAEAGAFSAVTQLAGTLGDLALASQGISLTLISATFNVTLGIATATGTRVGKAVGRGDRLRARRSGFLGLALSTAFMLVMSIAFVAAPRVILGVLTDKPDVIAASVSLLAVAALFQIFDGGQVVMVNALRGAGDTKYAQYANMIGYYAIGIPISIALGIFAKQGVPGLWWGLCVGLVFVCIALVRRFHVLSSKPIARA